MSKDLKICAICERRLMSCPCCEGVPRMPQEETDLLDKKVEAFLGKKLYQKLQREKNTK